jgi:LmbE family N-acetylglucosaminyl deacetylase
VSRTVLHLAPHPDDELIGSPAALMALRDAGWRIVNLACSLGAPGDTERREAEVHEACHRAGFELEIADVAMAGPLTGPPGELSSEGVSAAQEALEGAIDAAIDLERPEILVAPSPQDNHPGHEVVGRAAVAVCERADDRAPRLWLWGLWADLPLPTLAVGFGEVRMREVLHCLEAHQGELGRNDYRRLVEGRAQMNSSLGPERVFGFGSRAPARPDAKYVELLCELALDGGSWQLGRRRWLDAADPLDAEARQSPQAPAHQGGGRGPKRPIGDWLHGSSVVSLYRT